MFMRYCEENITMEMALWLYIGTILPFYKHTAMKALTIPVTESLKAPQRHREK
ncbi:hypothetical protein MNV_180020 [Candidatus Methanoperedens nitroreducens]|uniref:Uncharacterized protein n=1 Tax=Candidatus Methanoperedens nitratireducens TaxID=1392998 RepID=A0A284VMB2_9EURY|nr:hypothetical protein MNV_180020 [Candidatus Methanoperedens nitroreducens]